MFLLEFEYNMFNNHTNFVESFLFVESIDLIIIFISFTASILFKCMSENSSSTTYTLANFSVFILLYYNIKQK